MTYHDWFRVGDVITIDNADRPEWVAGRWRVVTVQDHAARLEPVVDGPDDRRDPRAITWLTAAGIRQVDPRP
jgi:hypothetical protein